MEPKIVGADIKARKQNKNNVQCRYMKIIMWNTCKIRYTCELGCPNVDEVRGITPELQVNVCQKTEAFQYGIREFTVWFTWLSVSLLHVGYKERH